MMEKVCGKCQKSKSVNDFWVRRRCGKETRQAFCKECSTKRRIKYYIDNKNRELFLRNKRAKEISKFVVDYKKNKKCEVCGDKRWYVLHFHHKGNKEKSISKMVTDTFSIEHIKKEICKCNVLCSNCHIELHFLQKKFINKFV